MSIIMFSSECGLGSGRDSIEDPQLSIQHLLDHIAIELAEEYVRLMQAAAAEVEASPNSQRTHLESEREDQL